MSRKIYVQLEARDIKDNPDLLKLVSEVFQKEDIHLNFSKSALPDKISSGSKELENKALDELGPALEINNDAINQAKSASKGNKSKAKPKTTAEASEKVAPWYSKINTEKIAFGMEVIKWAAELAKDSGIFL